MPLKTERVKGIKADVNTWDNLHYGIEEGEKLELLHFSSNLRNVTKHGHIFFCTHTQVIASCTHTCIDAHIFDNVYITLSII